MACFSIRESDRCLETVAETKTRELSFSFSIRESDRCLETGRDWLIDPADLGFSIRESDRCLETRAVDRNTKRNLAVSVSASRIVASKLWPV